jgi:hypothetical protein
MQEIEEYIKTIGPFNSAQINYILGQNDIASSAPAKSAEPEPLDPLDPSDFPDPTNIDTNVRSQLARNQ